MEQQNITAELQTTFRDSALSSSTVKRWIRKFNNGDLSRDDDSRPGRRMSISGPVLQKFLDRYPFSSTRLISRHFRIFPSTVKEILRRELGLTKFSRRWVPHLRSNAEKKLRVDASRKLLSLLGICAEHHFERIATDDESWFQYASCSDSMFAGSRESVVSRIRPDFPDKKLCFPVAFHQDDFSC
jgi:transposase